MPDVLLLASAYPEWTRIGGGTRNFLTFGGFAGQHRRPALLPPRGSCATATSPRVLPMDQQKITEQVARSWYRYSGGGDRRQHPYQGETEAELHGPEAALRVALDRRPEVLLAEGAALRRAR